MEYSNNNKNDLDSSNYPICIQQNRIWKIDSNTFYMSRPICMIIPIILLIQGIIIPLIFYLFNKSFELYIIIISGSIFLIGIICSFLINTGVYLYLEAGEISIRKKALCIKKCRKVFYTVDLDRAELTFGQIYNEDGYYYTYNICLIKKNGKSETIFSFFETVLITDLSGLNYIINNINSYIKNVI